MYDSSMTHVPDLSVSHGLHQTRLKAHVELPTHRKHWVCVSSSNSQSWKTELAGHKDASKHNIELYFGLTPNT